jgi:hypothetical protein
MPGFQIAGFSVFSPTLFWQAPSVVSEIMFILCPDCGNANSGTAKVCKNCGMPLRAEAAEAAPPTTTSLGAAGTGDLGREPATPSRAEPSEAEQTTAIYATRADRDAAVSLEFNFPRLLFAGHASLIQMRVKNVSALPLEQVEVLLESRGLKGALTASVPNLPAGQAIVLPLAMEPARAGTFVFQCSAKLRSMGILQGYIGSRSLGVNPVPNAAGAMPSGVPIYTNQDIPAGDEADAARLSINRAAMKRAADWLDYTLPELYQPLKLALDFQLSVAAADYSTTTKAAALIIPRLFLGYVQSGDVIKLTPVNPDQSRAMHLVARPQFKLGRSREHSDFITWFMPRTRNNDDKTRQLSKMHVLCECRGTELFMRDGGSAGGSGFDGTPLSAEKWEPINRRGVLALRGEYFLDVLPLSSAYTREPDIKNIRLWVGPTAPAKAIRGAVRFAPINSELAHADAIWLFTDATFGTSRSNPIVLPIGGLAEIQGRFHHYRGCFWLENHFANEAVRINSLPLNANEIAPLINGQILQLGQTSFTVEVVAGVTA